MIFVIKIIITTSKIIWCIKNAIINNSQFIKFSNYHITSIIFAFLIAFIAVAIDKLFYCIILNFNFQFLVDVPYFGALYFLHFKFSKILCMILKKIIPRRRILDFKINIQIFKVIWKFRKIAIKTKNKLIWISLMYLFLIIIHTYTF